MWKEHTQIVVFILCVKKLLIIVRVRLYFFSVKFPFTEKKFEKFGRSAIKVLILGVNLTSETRFCSSRPLKTHPVTSCSLCSGSFLLENSTDILIAMPSKKHRVRYVGWCRVKDPDRVGCYNVEA